ncbi:MAG TPA: hypothetical protein VFY32_04415 [Solirubrobacteraceae bacterium]|nr:hypothetical protein [Solirubrobacteraceae bacterium]
MSSYTPFRRLGRNLAPPGLAMSLTALALVIAGCGGGANTTGTSGSSGAGNQSNAELTACLKKHGVTLPAGRGNGAPPAQGGGYGTPPAQGSGTPPAQGSGSAPKMSKELQAALSKCGATRPNGGPAGSTTSGPASAS